MADSDSEYNYQDDMELDNNDDAFDLEINRHFMLPSKYRFSGECSYIPIEKWLRLLLLHATLGRWSDNMLLEYAKNGVVGRAAAWLSTQGTIETWDEFKQKMMERFARLPASKTPRQSSDTCHKRRRLW